MDDASAWTDIEKEKIIRLRINAGKQTDLASRRTISVVPSLMTDDLSACPRFFKHRRVIRRTIFLRSSS